LTVVEKIGFYSITLAALTLLLGLLGLIYVPQTTDKVGIGTSVLTAISIQFLVYDRLRDSALRRLDFLNKKALSPALKVSKGTVQGTYGSDSVFSKSQEMLQRHGKFLGVKLYPKKLPRCLPAERS